MNDDLTWRFDIAVIEWLIILAMLVILAVVGAVVTRQSLRTFRKQNGQTAAPASTAESWHVDLHVQLIHLDGYLHLIIAPPDRCNHSIFSIYWTD